MYHAHYGMQSSDGLVGMIIVSVKPGFVEPFKYDHDRNILLTDWWHKSKSEQTTGLLSKPFTWVGEPQVSQYITINQLDSTACSQ